MMMDRYDMIWDGGWYHGVKLYQMMMMDRCDMIWDGGWYHGVKLYQILVDEMWDGSWWDEIDLIRGRLGDMKEEMGLRYDKG